MRAALVLLALTAGCASRPAPVVTPPAPITFARGVNDGFHGPVSAAVVAEWCAWSSPWIRTPHLSADSLRAFVASAQGCPSAHVLAQGCPSAHVLALIEGPDPALAAALASVSGVEMLEVGNELELAPHELTPEHYAQAVAAMYDAARAAGLTGEIIAGGVYAITPATKQAVALMLAACPDCSVGLHVYQDPTDDLPWIRSLNRRVWVTETGSPTGCGTAQWQAQADWLRGMFATLAQAANVVGVIVYQRPAGPTCSDLDTFSIAGKPAEELLK